MPKPNDNWCDTIEHNGKLLHGGAARNVRLSAIERGAQGVAEKSFAAGYAKAFSDLLKNQFKDKKKK